MKSSETALIIGILFYIIAYLFVINHASAWCYYTMMGVSAFWVMSFGWRLWKEIP